MIVVRPEMMYGAGCQYICSEEITRKEVGCGGNDDVKMDEWSHQAGQNKEWKTERNSEDGRNSQESTGR